jgi:2-C-methyl-D-erythritol 4-phosphate cytidylyltransferase
VSRPVVHALIPAAGRGERFGGSVLKQYLPVAGKPVLARAIEAVNLYPEIAGITVVIAADDNMFASMIQPGYGGVSTVTGGASRPDEDRLGAGARCRAALPVAAQPAGPA